MSDIQEESLEDEKPRRGAPKGNQFWKARAKHGRDKLFASAELLWESCCEYFQWVEDNPLWEAKAFSFQGESWVEYLPKMQAMTIGGICIFLDIDETTWRAWRSDKDFSTIITRAEKIIYQQKFTGAAADLLNANIIARDLGLKDTAAHEHTSPDGSMTPRSVIDTSKLSAATIAELMAAKPDDSN